MSTKKIGVDLSNSNLSMVNENSNIAQKNIQKKWVEVIPHGLVGGMIPNLCLMIFKEKAGSKRFAIFISRLQGQISIQQSMNKEEPFRFIIDLLNAMKIKIEKCYFSAPSKGNINILIVISGHPTVNSISLKANDVLPFAVYSGCRFYCTDKFINEMLNQKMEYPYKKKPIKSMYLN